MKNLGAEHENLDHKVYQILKKMIIERELLPGKKIPQEKLAKELGISRTPLISALKFLEHEKLVEVKPRRGFFVRLFTKREMIGIFELREVLEGLAARRAAKCITDDEIKKLKSFFKQFDGSEKITDYKSYSTEDRDFHNYITVTGSKEFLKSILHTYNIISLTYQVSTYEGLVRDPNETLSEHLNIIKAICKRDPVSSEKLMRQHLKKGIDILMKEINGSC